jgi:hypothetical protein
MNDRSDSLPAAKQDRDVCPDHRRTPISLQPITGSIGQHK